MSVTTEQTNVVTMVNVFTVKPHDQARLVDLIVRTAEDVMAGLPGYVSNTLHKSRDGERVLNYVRWEGENALRAALRHPDAQPLFEEMLSIATLDHHLYDVVYVRDGSSPTTPSVGR